MSDVVRQHNVVLVTGKTIQASAVYWYDNHLELRDAIVGNAYSREFYIEDGKTYIKYVTRQVYAKLVHVPIVSVSYVSVGEDLGDIVK